MRGFGWDRDSISTRVCLVNRSLLMIRYCLTWIGCPGICMHCRRWTPSFIVWVLGKSIRIWLQSTKQWCLLVVVDYGWPFAVRDSGQGWWPWGRKSHPWVYTWGGLLPANWVALHACVPRYRAGYRNSCPYSWDSPLGQRRRSRSRDGKLLPGRVGWVLFCWARRRDSWDGGSRYCGDRTSVMAWECFWEISYQYTH